MVIKMSCLHSILFTTYDSHTGPDGGSRQSRGLAGTGLQRETY